MNQDLINSSLQKFEVEDNYIIEFVIDFILVSFIFILPILLLLFFLVFMPHILLDYRNVVVILILFGFLYVPGIPISRKFIKNRYPIYSVKFIITKEFIEIQIQNHSYLTILWTNVRRIKVINESFLPYFIKTKNLFKLRIEMNNETKEIRLFILRFRKKTVKLILNSLEKISKFLNKEFIKVKEVEKRDYFDKQQLNDISDIRNFQNKLKAKKK